LNDEQLMDVNRIKDLIVRWAVYRDALMWDKFRAVWHKDGIMKATWFEGSYEEFIRINEEGVKRGLNILHILGGSAVELKGTRATAMTKFLILQRAVLDGILCDVTNYARHFDLWEKRENVWGLVRRVTICDKDRLEPVDTNEKIHLDPCILNRFPQEYKHLAYLQTKVGYIVDPDVPRMSGGMALEAVYRRGDDWLAGNG